MTQEKVIGSRTYRATQLPAMRALRLLARLGKAIAPAMASIMDAEGEEVDLEAAARALFDRLSEDDLESLIKGLLEPVTVDGRPVLTGFDAEYSGKLDEVFHLVRFSLEVQFGGFFAALAAAVSAQRQGPKASA